MSRSARDATRFTPNVAQSYARASQPGARSRNNNSPSFQSGAPAGGFGSNADRAGAFNPYPGKVASSSAADGETTQQKVARLRAEHMRRKAAQLTTWDRIIVRGRSAADAAHRWTILGILTFSAIAGALTIYSAVDMIRYNRRKNKEFYKQYQQLWEERHAEARAAESMGNATDTQLAIVKQEREAQEFYQKREGKGMWASVKSLFSFKGLSDNAAGTQSWDKTGDDHSRGTNTASRSDDWNGQTMLNSIEDKRREAEKRLENEGFRGGPLDQAAAEAVKAAASASQSNGWLPWGKRES